MKLLAFESSAKAASVALYGDGVLLCQSFMNDGQTHSRTLTKMADDLLRNASLTPGQIDAVACAAGPGSFTGVRIGVSAAKGFAWGAEKPCVGVSTLEAMAECVGAGDGVVCAVMDARRAQVYNALFRRQNGAQRRLCEDRAISLAALGEALAAWDEPIFLVGDGALLCYDALHDQISNLRLLPEHLRQQRASGVAIVAARMLESGCAASAKELVPNYLRLSQAERERLAKQQ
ncbi:MAG: tRNA (adenosine(37)-N6)-threonylcarbamoyltransferase complex dimerization subunit type 1 TsaB [Oscillospiraceae bacterium]|nr:tRNA (adenosine(37)-N6)-threonylcarbamoyltransferase complex dimerization subunit type 1 TsaB [Oscillospiraceae bacterium]